MPRMTAEESVALHRSTCHRYLQKLILMGGFEAELRPSNMLAGPCDAIHQLPARMKPEEAPLLPLADCEHPVQCGCTYRAILADEDDMRDWQDDTPKAERRYIWEFTFIGLLAVGGMVRWLFW